MQKYTNLLNFTKFFAKKITHAVLTCASVCDSGGIQTPNLLIRSQLLYSVKLRSHLKIVCKGTIFFSIDKKDFHFFYFALCIFLIFKILNTGFFCGKNSVFAWFFTKKSVQKRIFDVENCIFFSNQSVSFRSCKNSFISARVSMAFSFSSSISAVFSCSLAPARVKPHSLVRW